MAGHKSSVISRRKRCCLQKLDFVVSLLYGKEALVKKRRWFIILAIFFLVQGITAPHILSFESNSLNPATKLNLNYPEGRLKQLVADAVYFGKDFIMRIFLKEDNRRQQALPILYEGRIEDPAVVFQVLPSLNEILSSCKIKPRCTYSTRQVDSSP